jgi:xanthine dehydrogenase YagR molybdenum-binding subunit
MSRQPLVGQSVNRLEGKLKVTGAATYAAEYLVPDLLYGYVVNSAITKGKIVSIDTTAAKAFDGVVEILTHKNRPGLAWFDLQYADMDAPPGMVFKPLHDNEIKFNGQPVALVIATDFETARYAATLVTVEYEAEEFVTSIHNNLSAARDAKKGMATLLKPPPPKPTGDFEKAFAESPFKVQAEFNHSPEHHNPMEMYATTTMYEGDGKLTIYDKTQGTVNNQMFVANVFGLSYKDVRVIAPFVGGGFGSGLRPQFQLFLCVMAALHLKRNVRVSLERKQMFAFSHRPESKQKVRFSSDAHGLITGLNHEAFSETSQYEDYVESVSNWSHKLYPSENTLFEFKVVPVDAPTPLDMRAPGGVSGMHAIECAMDELAFKLKMDPVEFRLKNYAEVDPSSKKPYTSKALKECYLQGAEKFGWSKRNPTPGSMTRGNKLVGYGMATGMWDAFQFPARMEAIINEDGKFVLNSAVTDIGTGTLTIMTQIAADQLGLNLEDVIFNYGDSKKPFSMFQGGSSMTSSTGVAIIVAAKALKKKLLATAATIKHSPFVKANLDDVIFGNGGISLVADRSAFISLKDIVVANRNKPVKTVNMGKPHLLKLRKYTLGTHSASFVEVEVDKDLKVITVKRALTAVAAGKIINPKTARSQISGSMVWGISKSLHEETVIDENFGKYMNSNLSEYHIPVHADINELDVIFVDEKDELINELGTKGVGEIGLVAMPAAVANAVFHATGKRIYDLPIHFDKLL